MVLAILLAVFVFVVGLFDLLSSTRAALADPAWPSPFSEAYLFIGFIYFALCFSTSLYSAWLEKYLGTPFSR